MTDDTLREAAKRLILCQYDSEGFQEGKHSQCFDGLHVARRLLELLQPASKDAGPPFDAWSFIRDVLSRGASIEQDSRAIGRTYEQFSARLDAVARELADRLKPHLKPTEPKS